MVPAVCSGKSGGDEKNVMKVVDIDPQDQ